MGLNLGLWVKKQHEYTGQYMDDDPGQNPKGTSEEINARFVAFVYEREPWTEESGIALAVNLYGDKWNVDAGPGHYGAGIVEPDWFIKLYVAMFAWVCEEFDTSCLEVTSYWSP